MNFTYLFKDRNQAVSGTFSYAISCGCPIISTPIPHAIEVLNDGTGIIIDFENAQQLAEQVNNLLDDEQLRKNISSNGIHKLAPSAWENSAISHAILFEQISNQELELHYKIPEINLNHFKNLTTNFAMIQFSIINQPDINSANGFNPISSNLGAGVILGRLILFDPDGPAGPRTAAPYPSKFPGSTVTCPLPVTTPALPSPYNTADFPGAFTGSKAALNNFSVPLVYLQQILAKATGGPAVAGNPAYSQKIPANYA